MPAAAPIRNPRVVRTGKERVLVEFPETLLRHADELARKLKMSRSELIRKAVEEHVQEVESKRFEQELAEAYIANAEMNLAMVEEFKHVDAEVF